MYGAQESGKTFSVFADETRPLLQGSRLTAWELDQAGIEYTVNAGDAAVGAEIGIGFYGRADAAFDDVTFEIIPEPSATLLLGFSAAGGLLIRRRRK